MKNQKWLFIGCASLVGVSIVFLIASGVFINIALESISTQARYTSLLEQPVQVTVTPHHIVTTNPKLALLWIQSDLPIGKESGSIEIAAANGVIVVTGVLSQTGREMIAIDSQDGKTILWRTGESTIRGWPSTLDTASSTLYVGYSGSMGHIIAFDITTGEELWKTRASSGRAIENIKVAEGSVYVNTESGKSRIAADTGKHFMFIENDEYLYDKAFIQNIRFRYDPTWGLRAIDRQTDKDLWANPKVIGPVAASETTIYALTTDNQFIALDPQTGQATVLVEFDTPPFIQVNELRHIETYQVTIDQENRLLYAFLGDSRQLFAFKVLDEDE